MWLSYNVNLGYNTKTCGIKPCLEGELVTGIDLHCFMSSNQWFGYLVKDLKGDGLEKW